MNFDTVERFRHVADTAPVMIWAADAAQSGCWFNRAWLDFVGRPLDRELGRGWTENVHPEDLGAAVQVFDTAFAARRPFATEYRLRRHDGEYRWILENGVPSCDPDGRFDGYIGSAVDVTDLKRAEEKLRGNGHVLALAMGAGRMGVWTRDIASGRTWWSPELLEIYGMAAGEFDGRFETIRERIHPDDRETVDAEIDRAIANRSDYVVEFRFRHASGEWRWIEGRGRVVCDGAGHPHTLYGVAMDVTRHKDVRIGHAFASAIVASSDDAIVGKTLQGVIRSWNRGAERLFGWTASEAIGRSIEIIIPPDHLDEEREILRRLARGERIEHFETIRRTKDGRLLDISLTVSPVRDESGRIVGASKIAHDITEQKRARAERDDLLAREQDLRARAEEASRLKDEFLATVLHELRTPLSAIVGWARLLAEGHLDAERERYAAEVIERNARAQTQLINDLLDVSRIVTGKLRLNIGRAMPAAVIESALESLRPTADARGIRLETTLDRTAGPITGDATRLQQVIWNLVSNAIKFTSRGGRVEVHLERAPGQITVRVSDTGQGISPEMLPHVFDRFRQGEGGTTRAHGGLGLGLAIVRHIVELHGGRVTAKSAGENQGSVFTVVLPLLSGVPASGFAPAPALEVRGEPEGPLIALERTPRLDDVRVVLVDDEDDSRAMLREVLERRGAEVRDASNAHDAYELVTDWRPAVLVSDIGMPGEDGYELVRRIRAQERGGETLVPAVALTAYARSEDRMRALLAGYQMHVAKPIDPAELVLVIAGLVGAPTRLSSGR